MRIALTAALFAAFGGSPALAWDGAVQGKVASVQVASAENYGFRVGLEGGPSMCGEGSATWAFVNKSFDNYDVAVSVITSAWLSGKPVVVYSTRYGSTNYCQIGFITAAN